MSEPSFSHDLAPTLATSAHESALTLEAPPGLEEAAPGKDFRTRTKRKPSYPFKMLANFADAKGHQPANPELGYIWVGGEMMVAADGFRMLAVHTQGHRFADQPILVPTDIFAKLKEKDNAIETVVAWLGATSYSIPPNTDLSLFPRWDSIILQPASCRFRAHRYRFMDRLELVGKTEDGSGVELSVSEGVARFRASSDGMETRLELAIQQSRETFRPFTARVNPAFLIGALDVIPGEHVYVSLLNHGDLFALMLEGEDPVTRLWAVVALAKDEVLPV